jgi:hypothetical protein
MHLYHSDGQRYEEEFGYPMSPGRGTFCIIDLNWKPLQMPCLWYRINSTCGCTHFAGVADPETNKKDVTMFYYNSECKMGFTCIYNCNWWIND